MGEGVPPKNPFEAAWMPVDVKAGSRPNEVIVDTSMLNGTAPAGLRYAWSVDCCTNKADKAQGKSYGCSLEACALMAEPSHLPPNPFMAHIANGKCKCMPP